MRNILNSLPWVLAGLRIVLGGAFPLGAWFRVEGGWYVEMLIIGLVSDICDGVLARKLGTATLALRRFDSNCDTVFYGGALIALVWLHGDVLRSWLPEIAGYFGVTALRHCVDWFRYRAQPSYHMYSDKLWGGGHGVDAAGCSQTDRGRPRMR